MTAKVARAAFPKGNMYMKMSEHLGQLYEDENFIDLYRALCGNKRIIANYISIDYNYAICRKTQGQTSSRCSTLQD